MTADVAPRLLTHSCRSTRCTDASCHQCAVVRGEPCCARNSARRLVLQTQPGGLIRSQPVRSPCGQPLLFIPQVVDGSETVKFSSSNRVRVYAAWCVAKESGMQVCMLPWDQVEFKYLIPGYVFMGLEKIATDPEGKNVHHLEFPLEQAPDGTWLATLAGTPLNVQREEGMEHPAFARTTKAESKVIRKEAAGKGVKFQLAAVLYDGDHPVPGVHFLVSEPIEVSTQEGKPDVLRSSDKLTKKTVRGLESCEGLFTHIDRLQAALGPALFQDLVMSGCLSKQCLDCSPGVNDQRCPHQHLRNMSTVGDLRAFLMQLKAPEHKRLYEQFLSALKRLTRGGHWPALEEHVLSALPDAPAHPNTRPRTLSCCLREGSVVTISYPAAPDGQPDFEHAFTEIISTPLQTITLDAAKLRLIIHLLATITWASPGHPGWSYLDPLLPTDQQPVTHPPYIPNNPFDPQSSPLAPCSTLPAAFLSALHNLYSHSSLTHANSQIIPTPDEVYPLLRFVYRSADLASSSLPWTLAILKQRAKSPMSLAHMLVSLPPVPAPATFSSGTFNPSLSNFPRLTITSATASTSHPSFLSSSTAAPFPPQPTASHLSSQSATHPTRDPRRPASFPSSGAATSFTYSSQQQPTTTSTQRPQGPATPTPSGEWKDESPPRPPNWRKIPEPGLDVFISHAGEQKASFVEIVCQELTKLHLKVFADEACLAPGSDARSTITDALQSARVAVVVLSKEYIRKQHPMEELQILLGRRQQELSRLQAKEPGGQLGTGPPLVLLPVLWDTYAELVAVAGREPAVNWNGLDVLRAVTDGNTCIRRDAGWNQGALAFQVAEVVSEHLRLHWQQQEQTVPAFLKAEAMAAQQEADARMQELLAQQKGEWAQEWHRLEPGLGYLQAMKQLMRSRYPVAAFLPPVAQGVDWQHMLTIMRSFWGLWDEIEKMYRKGVITDAFFREQGGAWARRGKRYRELVEPVDIANWYHLNKHVEYAKGTEWEHHGYHYAEGIVREEDERRLDNDRRPTRYLCLQRLEARVLPKAPRLSTVEVARQLAGMLGNRKWQDSTPLWPASAADGAAAPSAAPSATSLTTSTTAPLLGAAAGQAGAAGKLPPLSLTDMDDKYSSVQQRSLGPQEQAVLLTASALERQLANEWVRLLPQLDYLKQMKELMGDRYPAAAFLPPVVQGVDLLKMFDIMRSFRSLWLQIKGLHEQGVITDSFFLDDKRRAGCGKMCRELLEPVEIAHWYYNNKHVEYKDTYNCRDVGYHYAEGIDTEEQERYVSNGRRPDGYMLLQRIEALAFPGQPRVRTVEVARCFEALLANRRWQEYRQEGSRAPSADGTSRSATSLAHETSAPAYISMTSRLGQLASVFPDRDELLFPVSAWGRLTKLPNDFMLGSWMRVLVRHIGKTILARPALSDLAAQPAGVYLQLAEYMLRDVYGGAGETDNSLVDQLPISPPARDLLLGTWVFLARWGSSGSSAADPAPPGVVYADAMQRLVFQAVDRGKLDEKDAAWIIHCMKEARQEQQEPLQQPQQQQQPLRQVVLKDVLRNLHDAAQRKSIVPFAALDQVMGGERDSFTRALALKATWEELKQGLNYLREMRDLMQDRYPEAAFLPPLATGTGVDFMKMVTIVQGMRRFWDQICNVYLLGAINDDFFLEDDDYWAKCGTEFRELAEPVDAANWYYTNRHVQYDKQGRRQEGGLHYAEDISDEACVSNTRRPEVYVLLQRMGQAASRGQLLVSTVAVARRLQQLLGSRTWQEHVKDVLQIRPLERGAAASSAVGPAPLPGTQLGSARGGATASMLPGQSVQHNSKSAAPSSTPPTTTSILSAAQPLPASSMRGSSTAFHGAQGSNAPPTLTPRPLPTVQPSAAVPSLHSGSMSSSGTFWQLPSGAQQPHRPASFLSDATTASTTPPVINLPTISLAEYQEQQKKRPVRQDIHPAPPSTQAAPWTPIPPPQHASKFQHPPPLLPNPVSRSQQPPNHNPLEPTQRTPPFPFSPSSFPTSTASSRSEIAIPPNTHLPFMLPHFVSQTTASTTATAPFSTTTSYPPPAPSASARPPLPLPFPHTHPLRIATTQPSAFTPYPHTPHPPTHPSAASHSAPQPPAHSASFTAAAPPHALPDTQQPPPKPHPTVLTRPSSLHPQQLNNQQPAATQPPPTDTKPNLVQQLMSSLQSSTTRHSTTPQPITPSLLSTTSTPPTLSGALQALVKLPQAPSASSAPPHPTPHPNASRYDPRANPPSLTTSTTSSQSAATAHPPQMPPRAPLPNPPPIPLPRAPAPPSSNIITTGHQLTPPPPPKTTQPTKSRNSGPPSPQPPGTLNLHSLPQEDLKYSFSTLPSSSQTPAHPTSEDIQGIQGLLRNLVNPPATTHPPAPTAFPPVVLSSFEYLPASALQRLHPQAALGGSPQGSAVQPLRLQQHAATALQAAQPQQQRNPQGKSRKRPPAEAMLDAPPPSSKKPSRHAPPSDPKHLSPLPPQSQLPTPTGPPIHRAPDSFAPAPAPSHPAARAVSESLTRYSTLLDAVAFISEKPHPAPQRPPTNQPPAAPALLAAPSIFRHSSPATSPRDSLSPSASGRSGSPAAQPSTEHPPRKPPSRLSRPPKSRVSTSEPPATTPPPEAPSRPSSADDHAPSKSSLPAAKPPAADSPRPISPTPEPHPATKSRSSRKRPAPTPPLPDRSPTPPQAAATRTSARQKRPAPSTPEAATSPKAASRSRTKAPPSAPNQPGAAPSIPNQPAASTQAPKSKQPPSADPPGDQPPPLPASRSRRKSAATKALLS